MAVVFAVIPFGSVLAAGYLSGKAGALSQPIQLLAAPGHRCRHDLRLRDAGSIAVYGVVLGGWASNNKYGFLGGLRSGAQLISLRIAARPGHSWAWCWPPDRCVWKPSSRQQAQNGVWNCFLQPLGLPGLRVSPPSPRPAGLPFDLPEAEQELVGGYHTEYSGIKLMMYLVAEFLHMITASFLIVILFLGGWHFWGLTDSLDGPGGNTVTWMPSPSCESSFCSPKVMAMILFFMLVRWSWPRFRYDQLMDIGWKVMIPWGLVNLVVVAFWVEYGSAIAARCGRPPAACMSLAGFLILVLGWFVATKLDPTLDDNRPRRRLVSPDRRVESIEE